MLNLTQGSSSEQAPKYSDKMKVLLKTRKFPAVISTPIDPAKVNLDVMRPWISDRILTILGFEDDVVIEYIIGMLEVGTSGKDIHIGLTGFLESSTNDFMKDMWALLLSAQETSSGIPQSFLDAKKRELKVQKAQELLTQERLRTKVVDSLNSLQENVLYEDLEVNRGYSDRNHLVTRNLKRDGEIRNRERDDLNSKGASPVERSYRERPRERNGERETSRDRRNYRERSRDRRNYRDQSLDRRNYRERSLEKAYQGERSRERSHYRERSRERSHYRERSRERSNYRGSSRERQADQDVLREERERNGRFSQDRSDRGVALEEESLAVEQNREALGNNLSYDRYLLEVDASVTKD